MNLIKGPFFALTVAALAVILNGCSKGSSDTSSSSSAVSVSGIISVSSGSQKAHAYDAEKLSSLTVNLSTYTITCATLVPPVQTASVALNADGTFSINVPGALNQAMACHMVDSNGDNVGDFLISDSSSQDMNGNNQVSNTMALGGNANLGTISYDPDAQEVTVPKSAVATVIVETAPASADVFDPTGAWTIAAADFTLPPGVRSVCASGDNTCNGPPGGQTIFMKLWKGVTTAATPADVYGLQVWDSEAGFNTCGGKVGLPSTVQTSIGVDFSQQGNLNAEFVYPTTVNGFTDLSNNNALTNVNLTAGWKMDVAKSSWEIQPSCGPKDVTIAGVAYSNAWRCGPDSASKYQYQLGGGCVTTGTQIAVNVNDWGAISCGAASEDSDHVFTVACTGTFTPSGGSLQNVTCNNKWAVTNAADVVQVATNFDWSNPPMSTSKVASGTACSAFPNTTDAQKIAQLQCYSNYYYQSGMREVSSACLPKVEMDWSATDPLEFVKVDFRPEQMVFFDQYRPNADGTGGQILTREERYRGVNVNGSWINCRVIQSGGLSFKKISATKLLAIFQESEVTTSSSNPACMAEFSGKRRTFMFYLNK